MLRITSYNVCYTKLLRTKLINGKYGMENVVISVTQLTQAGQTGYIVVVKYVTEQNRLRMDARKMSDDVQLTLQLMNQPVKNSYNFV